MTQHGIMRLMSVVPTSRPLRARTAAVILAAGQGTRMKSSLPKVLHALAGRPLIHYPVRAALEAGCDEVIVVVGHGRALLEDYLRKAFGDRVKTAVQAEQRGTGDAASAGLSAVSGEAEIGIIFYGDVPLMVKDDLAAVAGALPSAGGGLAMATCRVKDPTGYGRILRDAAGDIREIREQKDLRTDEERLTQEINPGIFAVPLPHLREVLKALEPNNAQKELYLTDIVSISAARGVRTVGVDARAEILVGVNDRQQLVDAEATMHARIARRWSVAGATIRPGARIDDAVVLEEDVIVETGVVLRGETRVLRGAVIDVGSVITSSTVGAGALVKPYSVVTDSRIDAKAQVGPFSHLRPESVIGEGAHVGNFVETKKTALGVGAKANHLAYLGDGVIGDGANIGAGTIFCNYDGFQKHTTTIGSGAFIGSDSQIVAPVTIGANAYVGTGTTVTKDVPEGALALSRTKQENKLGYAERLRARFRAAKEAARAKKEG
jgi:bifunctional UDP-N-acetylglucosamine pyrophosphorylase/glucosamine-1-phosphate N-acetyltransferase